jgi:hypothetical protein
MTGQIDGLNGILEGFGTHHASRLVSSSLQKPQAFFARSICNLHSIKRAVIYSTSPAKMEKLP